MARAELASAGLWCLLSLSFGCVVLQCSSRWCSGSARSQSPDMPTLGLPERGPATGQVQPQPVPCPGTLDKSHQAIHRWPLAHWAWRCLKSTSHNLRPAAADAGPEAARQEVRGMTRPDFLDFNIKASCPFCAPQPTSLPLIGSLSLLNYSCLLHWPFSQLECKLQEVQDEARWCSKVLAQRNT